MSTSVRRLQRELELIHKNPMDNIKVKPNTDNIYIWYFLFDGPKDTPYENGLYAGKILFPKEYPSKAPDFIMLTPNGRFAINQKICLSYSGYHQESWSPIWTVPTMLQGLLSFMVEDTVTTGGITTSLEEKKKLSKASISATFSHPEILSLFCHMLEDMTL
jgi:ubiquitin-conjugating enzyme E2 J2